MTDRTLFDADSHQPVAPQRLTLAQQAVSNLLGVIGNSIFHDERMGFALDLLAETLPAARVDVPAWFVPMLEAAEAAALYRAQNLAGQIGSRAWWAVDCQVGRALADFFWRRAAAALDAHREREAKNAA